LALDLASLAAYQKIIDLETWLLNRIKEQKDSFVNQCLDYLSQKVSLEAVRQEGSPSSDNLPIPLSLEAMSTFLKVLSER
jgi:CCR4-NOT transcription complex subunit 1